MHGTPSGVGEDTLAIRFFACMPAEDAQVGAAVDDNWISDNGEAEGDGDREWLAAGEDRYLNHCDNNDEVYEVYEDWGYDVEAAKEKDDEICDICEVASFRMGFLCTSMYGLLFYFCHAQNEPYHIFHQVSLLFFSGGKALPSYGGYRFRRRSYSKITSSYNLPRGNLVHDCHVRCFILGRTNTHVKLSCVCLFFVTRSYRFENYLLLSPPISQANFF